MIDRYKYKYRAKLINGPRGWIYLSRKPDKDFRLVFVATRPHNDYVPMPKWNTEISERRIKDIEQNPHFKRGGGKS